MFNWVGTPAYRLRKIPQIERQYATVPHRTRGMLTLRRWSEGAWQRNGQKQSLGCSVHAYVGQVVRVNCLCAWVELGIAECLSYADPDTYKHGILRI